MPLKQTITLLAALLVASCAGYNPPVNVASAVPNSEARSPSAKDVQDTYVALAFSGGGTRATAFGYGMLAGMREATATPENPDGILTKVRLVTGVSGGSVIAANFGYKGPRALDGFREDFLLLDGEKYMSNSAFNPITIAKGLSGGANGIDTFGRFLDETLFHGATFGDLRRRSRIQTWINAADVANQTSFLFSPETFDALCSDFDKYPISHAVSASAAFPLVFRPIVLEPHHEACNYKEPDWLTTARYNPEATSAMRAYANALESYADPDEVQFLKLLDGGITDNFGTTGLAVDRARSRNAFSPLSKTEAVKMKRLLFLVANAATEQDLRWTKQARGPGGLELGMAIVQSAMGAATRTSYDAMRLQIANWEKDLIETRCAMPLSEVRSLIGSTNDWECTDVKFLVGEVSFDGLPKQMRDDLNKIPTRLRLPQTDVDLAIEAGRLSTKQNAAFNGLLRLEEDPAESRLSGANAAGQKPKLIRPVSN